SESLHARRVRCSAWFGVWGAASQLPPDGLQLRVHRGQVRDDVLPVRPMVPEQPADPIPDAAEAWGRRQLADQPVDGRPEDAHPLVENVGQRVVPRPPVWLSPLQWPPPNGGVQQPARASAAGPVSATGRARRSAATVGSAGPAAGAVRNPAFALPGGRCAPAARWPAWVGGATLPLMPRAGAGREPPPPRAPPPRLT